MGTDETLKALVAQLEALNSKLVEADNDLAPLLNEQEKLNAAKYAAQQAYNEQMQAFRKKQQEIDEAKFAKQQAKNEILNQTWAIQNQISEAKKQAEEEARLAAEKAAEEERKKREEESFRALSAEFDKATASAPWREWAKDHQIQAGRKIARDKRVILADPMGLGKTLSVIITADMAERGSQLASPDFPWLGEEKEVWVSDTYEWNEAALKVYENKVWPFNDEGPQAVRNMVPEVGKKPGYIPYDLRNTLIEMGIIKHIPAGYQKKIVNAIERPVGRKILYVCPAPLLRNVMEEWQRWSPHRSVTYIGGMSKAERNFVLDLTLPKLNEYVIIVNYEAWRRDKELLAKLAACRFDTLIFDEAHAVKDMKSQNFKGIKYLLENNKFEYVIPMTGTPILNRPQELFALLNLVNPFDFAHERDFLWNYCEAYQDLNGNEKWKFKPGGLDLLAKKIHKNFLRRSKDQAGIILPEKSIIYHELDRDDENYPMQAKARKHMKDYATIVIDENKTLQATAIIAMLTRLRQIETWPAGIVQRDPITKEEILRLDVEESQKLDYVLRYEDGEWEGLIPDVVEDERVIVFSQFKAPLHELQRRLTEAGISSVVLDGSTPDHVRDEIRFDFDRSKNPDPANAKWRVLLANYKAAGVGLTLTNATQLITLDEEWNPGKRDQAWDRIHRIGQTENVTINVIRTKNTIDQWLADIIESKESIVGGFESTMVSTTDIKEAMDSGLI